MNQGYPASSLELQQRILALMGRLGATNVITVPPLAAAVPISSTAAPLTVQWFKPMIVLGLYAQESTATAAKYAKSDIAIRIGNKPVFSDGQAETFHPLLGLVGGLINWFPINRLAQPRVDWTITWRNRDGAATMDPFASFAVIQDTEDNRAQFGVNR